MKLARTLWQRRPGRKRRFQAWLAEADRRYNELIVALLSSELRPDSNCVDVGCLDGELLAEMVRLAPEGRHVAYEPLPHKHAALVERFPQVEVRNAAVAARAGTASFISVPDAPYRSGLKPEGVELTDEVAEEIEVEVVRLDDDLPDGYAPALIKIDVEGAEDQVLTGAVETIKTHRPVVVFEHGLGRREHEARPERVYELLCGECDLGVYTLQGAGPLSLGQMKDSGEWNFVARPA